MGHKCDECEYDKSRLPNGSCWDIIGPCQRYDRFKPIKKDDTEDQEGSLLKSVKDLLNEVNCRVEHGVESNGHLEYVESELKKIISEEKE